MRSVALREIMWLPPLPAWMNLAGCGFAVRTWLASMLALYVAFALQLDSPVWSWLTVWIVAQPTPGMMLSKSLYRVVGTIAGAAIAVMLIALFAQVPELFVVALALLVGGCTVASNVLTNFRAYATVLAGYTAGIVASDAINAPDQVFLIAMARGSAILVGIASAILVNSIFAPHRAEAHTRQQLGELLKAAAHRAVIPWQAPQEDRLRVGKKLIDDVIAMNTQIEYAAAESGVFRLQANNARSLLAHLFGIISARRSLDAHLRRCGWPRHEALQIFHGVVIDLLNEVPSRLDRNEVDELLASLSEIRRQLAEVRPEQDAGPAQEILSARLVADRIDDLLEHLENALRDWRDIGQENWHREPRRVLNFHRDLRAAWINGLRAFVAICLTGAFWIASAWPHGPGALVFVSVMLSLFSSVPRPDRVGWAFFAASVPAVALGLMLKYMVVSQTEGFTYLLLASGMFLVPLGMVMANPKWTGPAVAFSLVFLNVAGVANPMVYDLADSINAAIAIEVGVLLGTLAYVLIFPPDAHAARVYVTFRIRQGLGLMATQVPIPRFSDWETRMYDRVNRLHDPENPSGSHTDEWFEAGLGALTLGNEILRLRHWLEENAMPAAVRVELQRIVVGLGRIRREPEQVVVKLQGGRARLAELDPGRGDAERGIWARVSAALEEIDVYLALHPRLLHRAPVP